ncbi:hypothetical protein [Haloplanus halobius]|uniref:hypothetical protein n=1 Tax=Haloplanus halobius TaxID=2934938 RepID=UPI00200C6B95|nr:hypothetical protein [Haloplanus sp. XH21]
MNRRGALSAVLTGIAALAGCTTRSATGPRTPPTPGEPTASGEGSMSVTDLNVEEAAEGHLRVLATVTNRSEAERTRTLRIRVTVGETRTTQRRDVTVPADDEREVVLVFESVAYADFANGGSLGSQLS